MIQRHIREPTVAGVANSSDLDNSPQRDSRSESGRPRPRAKRLPAFQAMAGADFITTQKKTRKPLLGCKSIIRIESIQIQSPLLRALRVSVVNLPVCERAAP